MKHLPLLITTVQIFLSTFTFSQESLKSNAPNLSEKGALQFIKVLPTNAFASTAIGITAKMKELLFKDGEADSAENAYKIKSYNGDFIEIENIVSSKTKGDDLNSILVITSFDVAKTNKKIVCVYTHFSNYDYVDLWEYDTENDTIAKKIIPNILFPAITTELFFDKNIDKEVFTESDKQKEDYNKKFYSVYNANEGDEKLKKDLMQHYYNPIYAREVKIFDYLLDLSDKTIYVSFNSDDIANKLFDDLKKKTNFVRLKWNGQKFKIVNK